MLLLKQQALYAVARVVIASMDLHLHLSSASTLEHLVILEHLAQTVILIEATRSIMLDCVL